MIGDAGAAGLARLLCRLDALFLGNNRIEKAGALALAKALRREPKELRTLDLRLNPLGPEGGRAILDAAAALFLSSAVNTGSSQEKTGKDNSTWSSPQLQTLVLSGCWLSGSGPTGSVSSGSGSTGLVDSLCGLVRASQGRVAVHMDANELGEAAGPALVAVLSEASGNGSHPLRRIEARGTGIAPVHLEAIRQLAK